MNVRLEDSAPVDVEPTGIPAHAVVLDCNIDPWHCRFVTEVVGYEEQERDVVVCEVHREEFPS